MTISFWCGLAFFLFSVYFVKRSLKMLREYEPSHRWPQTQGIILSSEASHLKSYTYRVEYEYEVNQKKYRGNRFALYTLSTECIYLAETITGIKPAIIESHKALRPLPETFEQQFQSFPLKKGDHVTAYYKSQSPDQAILLPGAGPKKYSDLTLAVMALCIGVALMLGNYFGYLGK